MDGFERITGREHEGLVEKCQENGWLKVGGFGCVLASWRPLCERCFSAV